MRHMTFSHQHRDPASERIRLSHAALGLVGGLGLVYRPLLRRPIMTWGASDAEANGRLPGDELLEQADGISTRAITIDAPASAVWPWLAQMGPSPRGGAYTYDWIENLLGLNMHSADRVLAEFQHPEVGDTIGFGTNRMRFERVEPEQVLAMRSEDGNWVWTFVLRAREGHTRLISRNRFRLPTLTARLGMIPMEPGSLLMERKMLHGIKQRAEQLVPVAPRRTGRGLSRGCGVTDDEMRRAMPGDSVIPDAKATTTTAITIRRAPDAVWPWIAQLGQKRGGFYSYEALENMVGCKIRNADRIVPEWQQPELGDDVQLAPDVPLNVVELDPGRALVLQGGMPIGGTPSPLDFTWAFELRPQPDHTTRLLVRERYGYTSAWVRFVVAPTKVISFVMSRKMLRGIRDRAERQATSQPQAHFAAQAGRALHTK